MAVWLALAAFLTVSASAEVVKNDATPLKTGCSADAGLIATLPQGATVSIRYALSGESVPCYKVLAETGGKKIEGFLPKTAFASLEEFEKGLHQAAWLDTPQVMAAVRASSLSPVPSTGVAQEAANLIESSHPFKALELLETELKTRRGDPNLLALAGAAAWRADDPRAALDYWKRSLDIAANPPLEELYRKVEHEAQSDHSNERVYGLRVLLRYESPAVTADTARQMAAVLDDEFARISNELGCSAGERIVAIAQSREAYRKTTEAAEWNGGQFDGRIRVPVFNGRTVDAALHRTLAHETVHACLTTLGRWPAWLHEGIAQKLSGDTLSPAAKGKIADMARQGRLPPLSELDQSWSRLDREHAELAYAQSLAAIEIFVRDYAAYGLRNLVKNPERITQIAADLDQRLSR